MTQDVTPRWPKMDVAERAQAYSPSTMVGGDLGPYIQAYVARSAAAYDALPNGQVLRYGEGSAQTVDVVVPQGAGPVPLHVFIHGGYWQELSKKESFFAAPGTVSQGIAFAAVDYTLAPQASLDEIVAEVIAALRHLRAQAGTLNIDPDRIVVSGSSAGAQLAAMAALGMAAGERPKGLVLISGIYDLRPLLGTYINDALGLDEAGAGRNSAAFGALTGFPPSVVVWGEHETDEFKRQSRHFAQTLAAVGREVEAFEVAGRNHFDIVHDLTGQSALACQVRRLAGGAG